VECVEGAVGRTVRNVSGGSGSSLTTYYLEVEGRQFEVVHDLYLAAPETGRVAIYVLAGSHRVVNLERLPDRALPAADLDHPAPPILAG
jgi:hypothetical protein